MLTEEQMKRKSLRLRGLRRLTILLGRLGIKCMVRQHSPYRLHVAPFANTTGNRSFDETNMYGLSMKEAKDVVERMSDRNY